MTRSIRRLAVVLALLLIALLVNVSIIQVYRSDDYRARADNQRVLLDEYGRERGPILVGAEPVARSVETSGSLRYLRVYPEGEQYASVTGFYSIVYGATGLERTENDVLSGSSDLFFVDRLQQLIAGQQPRGGAVTTTIDARTQAAAWEGLRGTQGAVLAIEPTTGRILAQVQSPSFDPNILSSHDPAAIRDYYELLIDDSDQPLINRPIVSLNPPGSTFKLVTAAAALASGRFTPESVLPGPAEYELPLSTRTLRNWTGEPCGPDGEVTLIEALAQSCNTAFAWLGNELGADALREQAEAFGFDTAFTTPLRASTSRFPDAPDAPQTALSAIGQFDVRATAMQMAMVTAGIGNNGIVMEPYLVQEIRGPDLAILRTSTPIEFGPAMSPEDAADLVEMMVAVVERGTAGVLRGITNADGQAVRVGAKTGTAQTGREDDEPVAWMVALAPATNPQIAVAVVVEGAGAAEVSGNALAGPIARAVIEAALR
jgi:peptidoglycan glycosyltransferase